MAAFGRDRGTGHAGRSGADHGHAFGREGLGVVQFGLGAGARIDQATGVLVLEHMVQAGLVAGDAGIDRLRLAGARLVGPLRIGQQRPRQRDHVGDAIGKDAFGHVRHVDAVAGDQRHGDVRLEFRGHLHERRAWHRSDDGGNARLMPADAGIDDRGAGGLDGLGLGDDLLPLVAVFHQVQQRQPVDDDEVGAAGLAHPAHDFHREAHALLRRAAPGVVALVGARRGEFVDEIAFRTHHFDAVVAGFARAACRIGVGGDLPLHAARGQRARGERVDRRLELRGRDRERVIAIAAGMQQLQADLRIVFVGRGGDELVRPYFPRPRQLAAERFQPADQVRREATGHHQADAAFGTLGEIGRQLGEIAGAIFQSRMHRAHQHAVADLGEAQVQRREQVRVILVSSRLVRSG